MIFEKGKGEERRKKKEERNRNTPLRTYGCARTIAPNCPRSRRRARGGRFPASYDLSFWMDSTFPRFLPRQRYLAGVHVRAAERGLIRGEY